MKWHYFNENDKNCIIESHPYSDSPEKIYCTACGRPIGDVHRHTEDRSQVDCLKCLKRLNYKINNCELSPLKKAIRQVRGDLPPRSYPYPY